MARKKEPELIDINRRKIMEAAKELIQEKGLDNVSMNELAKKAEMSKSTLYVYFKSKEEIKDYLSLEAMEYLLSELKKIEVTGKEEVFYAICQVFVVMKGNYPLVFQNLIETIAVDEESLSDSAVLQKVYELGETVNNTLIDKMHLWKISCENILEVIFLQWSFIYGLITFADNKEEYLSKRLGITKEEYLQKGFAILYQMLGE